VSPGQDVITVTDPLRLGVMQVMAVLHNGRIEVMQLATEDIHDFDPHELEAFSA
jgi:uncharacterized protein with ACT and thioredoxin-like domain